MKKLIILLFSIFISINSYGGSLMKLFVLKQMGKILFFYQMRLIHILVNTYVNMTMVKRKKREITKTAN